MGLCAPAVVAAHAALESSAADDRLIVVPGQLVKVAGVFQFMGRVGQRREGHAVPCKADAYIQSAAGDSCTVHAGAAAALLRVDRGVLGKILPDVVVPRTHLAACSAVGGGLPGAKTQIGDFRQLPTQREEQTELRQLSARALPCHGDITAACAVINGGYLVQPHVVKQVLDADGNIIENVEPEVKRQVLSAETSATMRELLTRSVNMTAADGKTLIGGNKTGYVAGYKAGGKSGTSQRKQALKDEEQTYYSSYWGFAPGDDPQIAVLVAINDLPESATHTGGTIAAPVVGRIMEDVLPYIGITPVYDDSESDRRELTVPSVSGKTRDDAISTLSDAGFDCIIKGDGDTVTDQVPNAGMRIAASGKVIVYMGEEKPTEAVEVPNLSGMSPDECRDTLEEYGLYLKQKGVSSAQITGDTTATKQSPEAGTKVSFGAVVTVEFSDTTTVNDR